MAGVGAMQLNMSRVAQSSQWAKNIQKKESIEQQARIFYESYRIILVKEESYKEKINNQKQEIDMMAKEKVQVESDYDYLKKKY